MSSHPTVIVGYGQVTKAVSVALVSCSFEVNGASTKVMAHVDFIKTQSVKGGWKILQAKKKRHDPANTRVEIVATYKIRQIFMLYEQSNATKSKLPLVVKGRNVRFLQIYNHGQTSWRKVALICVVFFKSHMRNPAPTPQTTLNACIQNFS